MSRQELHALAQAFLLVMVPLAAIFLLLGLGWPKDPKYIPWAGVASVIALFFAVVWFRTKR